MYEEAARCWNKGITKASIPTSGWMDAQRLLGILRCFVFPQMDDTSFDGEDRIGPRVGVACVRDSLFLDSTLLVGVSE